MQTELISPNLHVVLIHYPLGMLIAGTLIELFSFLWPRSTFRTAGRWMILIGALSTIPATFSGVYALRDVARVSTIPMFTAGSTPKPIAPLCPIPTSGDDSCCTCGINPSSPLPPAWWCSSGSALRMGFASRCI
jgi:hypothetical protein